MKIYPSFFRTYQRRENVVSIKVRKRSKGKKRNQDHDMDDVNDSGAVGRKRKSRGTVDEEVSPSKCARMTCNVRAFLCARS